MSATHIVHVVCTDSFAGTERYVLNAAIAMRSEGARVSVVGGAESAMRAGLERVGAFWLPGATVPRALRSLSQLDDIDIVVSHMTAADLAAVLAVGRCRVPIISTRHFAAKRGSSMLARCFGAWLLPRLAGQVAGSNFVAAAIEGAATVVHPGVSLVEDEKETPDRVVLVAQRLEVEKSTEIALYAWAAIEDHLGWRLVIAGKGVGRDALELLAHDLGVASDVDFVGFVTDVNGQLKHASIFLATAPAEPFGLSVVEAMAHGIPIVAAAGGGHLETVGSVPDAELFEPGDALDAARRLMRMMTDAKARRDYGEALRSQQRTQFDAALQGRRTFEAVVELAQQWRSATQAGLT